MLKEMIRNKISNLCVWWMHKEIKRVDTEGVIDQIVHFNLYRVEEKEINYKDENDVRIIWPLLKQLYKEILNEDPQWHWFYEGQYNIVRCSRPFAKRVIDFFDKHNVDYTYKGEWRDDSEMVREFQDQFTSLFHNFSVISMLIEDKFDLNGENPSDDDVRVLVDRVIHCFLNHQTYALEEFCKRVGIFKSGIYSASWEAALIATNAINRGHYVGYCDGVNAGNRYYQPIISDLRDELEELKEEKEQE